MITAWALTLEFLINVAVAVWHFQFWEARVVVRLVVVRSMEDEEFTVLSSLVR